MTDRSGLAIVDAPVQLAIIDLMGTLLADDGLVARAYDAALREAGVTSDAPEYSQAWDTIRSMAGRPTLDVLTAALTDPVRAEESTWAFDDSVLASIPDLTEIPGASDALETLSSQGILLALTTSFTPEVLTAVLKQAKWVDRFAISLSARGQRRGHPAPDLLLEAILELRIDSVSQVALIGDNVADLEAGNRAGAGLVIGVRSGGVDESDLATAPHTHIVDSIVDAPAIFAAPRTTGQRRASDD